MSSRIVQQAVLQRLRQGPVEAVDGSLPVFGHDRAKIDEALLDLLDDKRIGILGATNANALFGKDAEAFYLPQHRHLCQP